MVQDIPPDSWVHGQDLQEGVEFRPQFDYLNPKKPYEINLFEWLAINGTLTMKQALIVNADLSQNVYVVPVGFTFFMISSDVTYNDTGSGSSGACMVVVNDVTKPILYFYGASGKDCHLTKNFVPPLILRSSDSIDMFKDHAVLSKNIGCSIQGYLVDNYKIKEDAIK